jgi:hypothetical protein
MILSTHGIVGSQIALNIPFEFTINTANTSTGSSTSTQFKLPLTTSTGLNIFVDWGDGNTDTITSHTAPEVTHTYASSGTYTVKIYRSLLGWRFNASGDILKMLNINYWGGFNISTSLTFLGCTNLTSTATDAPLITSSNLQGCFQNCSNFNGSVENWNVSGVFNFKYMFRATSFNQPLNGWNMISGSNLEGMFALSSFNQPLNSWNTSNFINLKELFASTPFNQNISSWDINQVTDFSFFMTGSTGLSTANYDALLIAWEAQAPLTGKSINFGGSKYTLASAAAAARASLIATYGWTITDGGI